MVAQCEEKNKEQLVPESLLLNEVKGDQEEKEEEDDELAPDVDLVIVVPAKVIEEPPADLKETSCARTFFLRYRGIIFAFISSILMSISHVLVRKSNYLSGSEQSILRYVIQIVSMLIIIRHEKVQAFGPPGRRKLLVLRGCAGTVGILSISFAVKFIAPSDAIALVHSNVVMAAVFARIFLKEKFSLAHLISIIFTISGVLLISQPDFLFKAYKASLRLNGNLTNSLTEQYNSTSSNQTSSDMTTSTKIAALGIGLSLMGAMVAASVPILIKQLTNQKVHFAVVIIYASYIGLPAAIIISVILHATGADTKSQALIHDKSLLVPQLGYALAASVIGLLAQISVNMAIKYEDTSKIAIIRSSDVLFTFLLQHFIIGLDSNMFSVIGAVLVVMGSVCVILYQIVDRRYTHHLKKALIQQDGGAASKPATKFQKFKKIFFFKI